MWSPERFGQGLVSRLLRARLPVGVMAVLLSAPAARACAALQNDRIFARDLAAADSGFSSLDPDTEIGFAPRPGVTRIFRREDLAKVAHRYGLTAYQPRAEVCFLRQTAEGRQTITATRLLGQTPAPEVTRGESVAVEVQSGAARLTFDAKAESSGKPGDTVLLRNPENGRLFQARVVGKGKALVQR